MFEGFTSAILKPCRGGATGTWHDPNGTPWGSNDLVIVMTWDPEFRIGIINTQLDNVNWMPAYMLSRNRIGFGPTPGNSFYNPKTDKLVLTGPSGKVRLSRKQPL